MKRNIINFLLFGILMTISITVNAQLTEIKDLQATLNNGGSNPTSFIEAKGYLYFVANEPSIGNELWRTDGTDAGTMLVKDIRLGSGSSNPVNLVVYRDTLYFQADDGLYGRELWKSDGTEGGTVMVMDIYPGSGRNGNYSSSPTNFIIFKDSLYFQARDGNGTELWKSDGTEDGTRMVKNIYTGSGGGGANSSNPQNFVVVNGVLFFQAKSNNNGIELWKSDGTSTGTVLVTNINAGSADANPRLLTGMNNILFFVANNATNGEELWRSDGTAGGTVMVKDIIAGSGSPLIDYMICWGNYLYFAADNGTEGSELWKSDGIVGGTIMMIQDINTGSDPSNPGNLIVYKGGLYFTANDGFAVTGFELWKTTDGNTLTQLKDIFPGSQSSSPALFTISNNFMYFVALSSNGNELWKTNGTDTGTKMVANINPGNKNSNPRDLAAYKNEVFFGADNGINYPDESREPWKSNGYTTTMLKNIVGGTKPAYPSELINISGTLYFSAESTNDGNELFKSNGTVGNIALVKQILIGASSSSPKHLTNVNNVLFFTANDGNGYELWSSNGTTTAKIKSINPNFVGSDPDSFCVIGNTLYFTANDGTRGFELWKSNGTAAGTVLVKDIDTSHTAGNPNSSNPYGLTNVNGKLFFRADDGINGAELWMSDPATGITAMVKNINNTGSKKSSDPTYLCSFDNKCFFQADDGANGVELWKSDGTLLGTEIVKDIYTGSSGWGKNSSSPQNFTTLFGYLYFQAASNSLGRELWRTDGSWVGTTLVKDISPGSSGWSGAYSSSPMNLTKVGNDLFFAATTRNEGTELWKTDGTSAGTVMVKDINSIGKSSSNPNNLLASGNILYFVASDGIHGSELWKVENNQCSEVAMTGEINPGNGGTGPSNLAEMNGVLYFSASTTAHGSELWKYNNVIAYSDTANLSYVICSGDSVLMNNKYYKIANTYRDSLKTPLGCDSLLLMKLTVNPVYSNNTVVQKCIGDSVLIQGVYRKVGGTYTDSLNTINGCDSIVEVTLSFSPKPPKPVITLIPTITMSSSAPTGNQWYDENGPIKNATGQTYATTSSTKKYYVIVTINGCSSEPSNSANPQLGSINNNNFLNLNIYPNPVSDKLIIEFKENQKGGYTFYINNLEGQAMITGKLTETKNEIEVKNLPKGIYFVKIISNDQIGLIKILKD